jgi:dTDP-4-dehydrorhamnose 3,5-epimerase
MRFTPTELGGLARVDLEPVDDERGSFARLHCEREFGAHGMPTRMVQTSLSRTTRQGTVRGMHFLWPPAREGKLVRCIRGRIYDAVIDLRPGSDTYGRHFALELSAANGIALCIAPGMAHGFQTLEDDCEVLYQMSDFYAPDLASGVRWNDPAFGIAWPRACAAIHERDATYTDFDAAGHAREVARRGGWSTPA